MGITAVWQKIYRTLASIRTGVILLILVVIFSALGTFILQRPTSEAGQLEKAYTPTTLAVLDRLGLTDVFHAWYFLTLLTLVSLSIIFVSIDRFPNAWRFYARPYRRPEPHFRAVLPHHTEIPIRDARVAIEAAERAFSKQGLTPERLVDHDEVSLYAEKNRFAVMAVYIIHASLLLIFLGGIIDGFFGYRGYMAIDEGTANDTIVMQRNGQEFTKKISFSVRCDSAGQENYKDAANQDTGMPKKYWSKLTVLDDGKEIKSKEIVVNDPLVYRGVRLFQSSMGQSGKLRAALVDVTDPSGKTQSFTVTPNTPVQIGPDTTLTLSRFAPDFYIQDNEVHNKSENPENPAFGFVINKAGQEHPLWIFMQMSRSATDEKTGYKLNIAGGRMAMYTGLQVSFEPGHWFVWAGCLLMLCGLVVAFYMIHMRFWAMAVHDQRKGPVLWVGGAFNKNKERFEEKYKNLVEAIERELRARESDPQSGTRTKDKEQSAREVTTVCV